MKAKVVNKRTLVYITLGAASISWFITYLLTSTVLPRDTQHKEGSSVRLSSMLVGTSPFISPSPLASPTTSPSPIDNSSLSLIRGVDKATALLLQAEVLSPQRSVLRNDCPSGVGLVVAITRSVVTPKRRF